MQNAMNFNPFCCLLNNDLNSLYSKGGRDYKNMVTAPAKKM